jgi:hypothetical protein
MSVRLSAIWCGIIPAAACLHALWAAPVHPLLTPDSPGYLYFAAGRPLGYPVLLWALSHGATGYAAVRPAQILLFCASGWALGVAALGLAGLGGAMAVQALLFGYPPPLQQADQILADCVSSCVAILFVAAVLRLAGQRSARRYWVVVAVAGLGVTIRPDNLALAAAALLAACMLPTQIGRWRCAAGALIVVACCAAATPVAQHVAPDRAAQADQGARLARGLIQKVLFLPGDSREEDACDGAYIGAVSADLVAYWRAAPARFQDVLRLRISNLLRYGVIFPGLAARHGADGIAGIEPVLMCYTTRRLRAQPLAAAEQAVREYYDLMLNYTFVGPGWVSAYRAYLLAHPAPMPRLLPAAPAEAALWRRALADTGGRGVEMVALERAQDEGLSAPPARNVAAIAVIDAVQAVGCAVSLGALAGLFWPRAARAVLPCAVLALALQLHLLATAVLEIAQPRYVFPVWPLLVGVLFLAGLGAVRRPGRDGALPVQGR